MNQHEEKKIGQPSIICTWNVKTTRQTGKICVLKEMDKLKTEIMSGKGKSRKKVTRARMRANIK